MHIDARCEHDAKLFHDGHEKLRQKDHEKSKPQPDQDQRAKRPERPPRPSSLDAPDGETEDHAHAEVSPADLPEQAHPGHTRQQRNEESRHQRTSCSAGRPGVESTASS